MESPITQKGTNVPMMCTCAKQKHVASDRARRENVTVKNTTNIEREELRQMKTNTDLFEKAPGTEGRRDHGGSDHDFHAGGGYL